MGLASTVLDAESCVYRMQNATEGTIKETTYWWPRPSEDEPFESRLLQEITCRALMSATGTKRTSMLTLSISAFRGKADIPSSLANVR